MDKKLTYFVSDERMLLHKNDWDNTHIEIPERLSSILEILKNTKTLDKCKILESKIASIKDICLVHSKEYVDEIYEVSLLSEKKREEYCSTKEDIYINEFTWQSSLLAAGSAIYLLETILNNPGSNGFAAIRPPGHHASFNNPCGFCIFNNVAICAKKARAMGLERVLIIDWDIHAGQGTQYCIDNDLGIKLISIHRFENGKFWPELPESAVQQSYKNTINIPLNEINYSDAEYAAIFNFFIIPFIKDWKPQLILVSCGYDAAIGDVQGNMNVTPGGFNYMTGLLASLNIPLCMILEGGYFIESLALSALYTINALIDRKPLNINLNLSNPSKNFVKFLFSIISHYAVEYPIFNLWIFSLNKYLQDKNLLLIEPPKNEYKGERKVEFPYQTRGLYPSISQKEKNYSSLILSNFLKFYNTPVVEKNVINALLTEDGKLVIEKFSIQLVKNNLTHILVIFFYILIPLSYKNTILFKYTPTKKTYKINNGFYEMFEDNNSEKKKLKILVKLI